MIPKIDEINEMSEKLRMAIVATLNLEEEEKVFVGNEEKLFLYALFQYMPSSVHPNTVKITNPKELTFFRMIDIWGEEEKKRPGIKKGQGLTEKIRSFIIWIRSLYIRFNNLFRLGHKLKNNDKLIHYAAHMRYGSFVIPNLTSFYGGYKDKKDQNLRKEFSLNLSQMGLDSYLVGYLADLFPTSHLESYFKYSAHKISNIKKVNTVVTSLAGIMDDPLLSFLVKNNSSKLIFVQHGGGYGLNMNHLGHQIEDSGADVMYYWGTGDNNVYPTRYRNKFFSSMHNQVLIVSTENKDKEDIKPYIVLAENLTKEKKISCMVCVHPNGPRFNGNNVQNGVGYRQHEKARLVVYENIHQSLIYTRILSKRPFLILDYPSKMSPKSNNAFKFISLLREAGILIEPQELEKKVNFWMQFSPKDSQSRFEKKAKLVFKHILDQPKLNHLLNIN